MKQMIYVGGFESGHVMDPETGACYAFEAGKPFEVPEALAATLGPDFTAADQLEEE